MYPDQKDVEELRRELKDYYGTAMMNGFPSAMADLNRIEDMTEEELQETADDLGLD